MACVPAVGIPSRKDAKDPPNGLVAVELLEVTKVLAKVYEPEDAPGVNFVYLSCLISGPTLRVWWPVTLVTAAKSWMVSNAARFPGVVLKPANAFVPDDSEKTRRGKKRSVAKVLM